jgi:two-component system nitrate/nitrite response regulator NarL
LVREGLTRILYTASFNIVASVARIDDAVLSLLTPQEPILLIIDSDESLHDTAEQIRRFKERRSAARVAVLADHCRIDQITSAFLAGADAYFVGVANWDAFIKSLELVMLGERILPSTLLPFILDRAGHHDARGIGRGAESKDEDVRKTEYDDSPHLSAREKCILHYLIEGQSNKTIARNADISEATVKVHVKAILRKIGVQNRTQAAIWAMSNGSLIRSPTDSSSALEKGRPQTSSSAPVVPILNERQEGGDPLLPVIAKQDWGSSGAASAGVYRLVHKGTHREAD